MIVIEVPKLSLALFLRQEECWVHSESTLKVRKFMGINVPSLAGTGCVLFTACGKVATDDSKGLGSDPRTRVFRIGSEGDTRYVRLMGCQTSDRHCHIDVATPAYFPQNKTPEAEGTETQLQETLAPLDGYKIKLTIRSTFEVSLDNLPPLIARITGKMMVEGKGLGIKLTAGTLSLTGTPVEEISWRIYEIRRVARITLETTAGVIIHDSYLTDGFEFCKGFFEAFAKEGF